MLRYLHSFVGTACLVLASSCTILASGVQAQQGASLHYSTVHRDSTFGLTQTLTGPARLTRSLNAQRSGISVAVANFHRTATPDLVTGYATAGGGALVLQEGAPEVMAPGAKEMALLAAGKPITPFHDSAQAYALPVRPELLLAEDLRDQGYSDVLAAQRGDSNLYFLAGDGNGGLAAAQPIALRGAVSALSVWRAPHGLLLIVAAESAGANGAGLQLLDVNGNEKGFVPLPGAAVSIHSVGLNGGSLNDLIFVSSGKAMVLDGDSALSGSPHLETVGDGDAAVAITSGRFIWDKRGETQLAVLSSDATLTIYARPGLDNSDPTPAERKDRGKTPGYGLQHGRLVLPPAVRMVDAGWTEVERTAGIGSGDDPGAILLSGKMSAGGMDDLAVLSGSSYTMVSHRFVAQGSLRTGPAYVTVDSSDAPVKAAVTARISADSRVGVVMADAAATPKLAVPPTRTIYYVNTTADTYHTPSNCTTSSNTTCGLRDAIAAANAARQSGDPSSIDEILLLSNTPGGTITETTQNNYSDQQGDVNYHFNVEDSVNIVGSGTCTKNGAVATFCPTIIEGGSSAGSAKDLIFAINSESTGASAAYNPYDVFISNVQLQYGINNNDPNGAASGYEAANDGGLIYYDPDGAGTLTLTSVVLTSGVVNFGFIGGGGGCVGLLNGGTGGNIEIDNSTLSNCSTTNTTLSSTGGGLDLPSSTNLSLSNDVISGNVAAGYGGGVNFPSNQSLYTGTITNSVFSQNSAVYYAGGLNSLSALTMTGSTFTGNSISSSKGNPGYGAGALLNTSVGSVSVSTSTFTGNMLLNSAQGGAGIYTAAVTTPGPVTVQYSRFHNNGYGTVGGTASSVSGGGNALQVNEASNSGSFPQTDVTATNNWWSCNSNPLNGPAPCNTVANYATGSTLILAPYTTLTIGVSSATPAYGAAITATASLGQNSTPTVYSAANDASYLATPITAFTLTDTSSTAYNPSATAFSSTAATSTSYAAATATGTINATGTGTASVTVDGYTAVKGYVVQYSDLTVASTHSGNFEAGSTGNTYTLTVTNSGNVSSSGSVTLTDALPSGFTATALTGTGWTCNLGSLNCSRSDALAASASYSPVTLTVSVASSDAGTYSNSATVTNSNSAPTSSTGNDSTAVVGTPTIAEAFSPTTVAPNVNSVVTFTVGNPAANPVSLTGVAFSDALPSGLIVSSPSGAATTCSSGTVAAAANGSSIALSGATIAAGATCAVTVSVKSGTIGNYTNTTGAVSASNSNAGGTATAVLMVAVTPTKLVYTAVPASPITAGGNAGTVQVALEDGSGNVATGNSTSTVTLAVTGPASYSQTYPGVTVTNGVASFNLTGVPLTVTGSYTYTATSNGLSSTMASETVNPGAASSFLITGLSNESRPGVSQTATVKALDMYGNTATSFTGTVTLTSTDGNATLTPPTYTYTLANAGSSNFTVVLNQAGTFSVTATSNTVVGTVSNLVIGDAVEVINSNGTLSQASNAGSLTSPSGGYTSGAAALTSIGIDNAGNIFSLNSSMNALVEFSSAGTVLSSSGYTGGGLNAPVALAMDGANTVWVANGNGTLSRFTDTGAPVTSSTGYMTNSTAAAGGIAIDISGNVWISTPSTNTVTEVLGGAAPASPLAVSVASVTTGARP